MVNLKTKSVTEKNFNKGLAALKGSLLAILVLVCMVYINMPAYLMAVCCGVYAYITKMVPTYYKKSGPCGYAGLIWLISILGLPYFFYDLFKNRAIKAGQNVDTPHTVLFWVCVAFWILIFFLTIGLLTYSLSRM